MSKETKFKPGIGLDVGTGFIVTARIAEDSKVFTKSIRDAFLEITPPNSLVMNTMKKTLAKSGVSYIQSEDKLLILGQDALNQSVERQAVLQRPMSKGVISPSEQRALPVFKALLKELLGEPQVPNEKVTFTVPAAPIDGHFDVVYHSAAIQSILKDLGFEGTPLNEAQAIVFSELEEDDFTGVAISFGSGMTNIAISNLADLVSKFSIARGGDYIDTQSAYSLGFDPDKKSNSITPNLVTFTKEAGVDLLNPDTNDKIQLSISAHYKHLITYTVEGIVNHIASLSDVPRFLNPITVVVAGGTSLAPGFLQLLKAEFDKNGSRLPFTVKEIKHSSKPLTAVAEGCLIALHSE